MSRGGSKRKCALTMARNLVGVFRPGNSDAAGRGGTAMTTASPARERNVVVAKIQFADVGRRHAEAAQLMAELDAGALRLQQLERRLDQHRAEAVARDQRPAGLAARQQRFPHDRAGKPRRSLRRIDIERGQQQRLHQPLIQRALAGNGLADEFVRCRPDQRHQRQIIAQAGIGHPARLVEHP